MKFIACKDKYLTKYFDTILKMNYYTILSRAISSKFLISL